MEKYREMKLKKKANLKMLRNLVFFVLLIVFTFWYIFKDQDLNELSNSIHMADIKYVFIGFMFMFCSYLMESINIRSVLISLGEKKFSIFRAFKFTAIGAFFSAITPGSTGGQPAEVYYMTKHGIKTSNGTLAMLIELCGFQISSIILAVICGVLNPNLLGNGIIWFYILGIVANGCALTGILLGMFSNKLTKKFIGFVSKMIRKAKVRNYEQKIIKLEESFEQYTEGAKYIRKHKMVFVKGIIRVFVQVVLYHSIPYFIYRSFGFSELNYFNLLAMQSVLYITVAAIPIPGSVGVSETLFMKLYGVAFTSSLISGAMLLFRFVSFYIYIVVFSIIVIVNAIKSKNIVSEVDKNINEIDEENVVYS